MANFPITRGMMPTFWALVNGDDHVTVTLHEMVQRLDAGAVVREFKVPVKPGDSVFGVSARAKATAGPRVARLLGRIDEEERTSWRVPETTAEPVNRFPTNRDVQRLRARAAGDFSEPALFVASFDIEDWFHAENVVPSLPRRNWDRLEARLQPNAHAVLNILAELELRATFFVLGWVARRYPAVVRRIASNGTRWRVTPTCITASIDWAMFVILIRIAYLFDGHEQFPAHERSL